MAPGNWDPEEEQILKNLRERGKYSWHDISVILNKKFPTRQRTGKQCRERYNDYISFKGKTIKKDDWGPDELKLFWNYIQNYGLCWTKISSSMLDDNAKILGSSNTLKNKYYASLKTFMNRVNSGLGYTSAKSSIKWTPFKRFVCLNFYTKADQQDNIQNYQLTKTIVEKALLKDFEMSQEFLQKISEQIYNFNKQNRHLNARKLVVFKKNKKNFPVIHMPKNERKTGVKIEENSGSDDVSKRNQTLKTVVIEQLNVKIEDEPFVIYPSILNELGETQKLNYKNDPKKTQEIQIKQEDFSTVESPLQQYACNLSKQDKGELVGNEQENIRQIKQEEEEDRGCLRFKWAIDF